MPPANSPSLQIDINADPWRALREEMPVARRWAYFDHAAVSPLPRRTQRAITDWADDMANNGDANWPSWARRVEQTRDLASSLLNASRDEIALIRNTTEGVNLVAEGFPWRDGDNIVTPEGEFPTNRVPWQNLATRGVETRFVPTQDGRLSLDDLAAACDGQTRIVAISWVDFATGWRHDVAELAQLAHDRGALLFLDAIQGLGVFPLDVRDTGVDFLAADGHKWQLGPEGAGLFYLRREHLDLLRPLGLGWNSLEQAADFSQPDASLKPSAARYEGGSYPMPGFIGLRESLNLLSQFGVENLSQRILRVTDEACQGLQRLGARVVSDRTDRRRSGIVAFDPPRGDPAEVRRNLLAKDIVLSHRGGRLRISPHAYTNEDDLRRLFEALAP